MNQLIGFSESKTPLAKESLKVPNAPRKVKKEPLKKRMIKMLTYEEFEMLENNKGVKKVNQNQNINTNYNNSTVINQCKGIKANGVQCKRKSSPGFPFCFQHKTNQPDKIVEVSPQQKEEGTKTGTKTGTKGVKFMPTIDKNIVVAKDEKDEIELKIKELDLDNLSDDESIEYSMMMIKLSNLDLKLDDLNNKKINSNSKQESMFKSKYVPKSEKTGCVIFNDEKSDDYITSMANKQLSDFRNMNQKFDNKTGKKKRGKYLTMKNLEEEYILVGDSYQYRSIIKKFGGMWNKKNYGWIFTSNDNFEELAKDLKEENVDLHYKLNVVK